MVENKFQRKNSHRHMDDLIRSWKRSERAKTVYAFLNIARRLE